MNKFKYKRNRKARAKGKNLKYFSSEIIDRQMKKCEMKLSYWEECMN